MANVTVTLPYPVTVNAIPYSGVVVVDSVLGNGMVAMVDHANTGTSVSRKVSVGSLPKATAV